MYEFQVSTSSHCELKDITRQVQQFIDHNKIPSGICTVFIPHTTAAVTINENADPDVKRDLLYELDQIVPLENGYHHAEGNSAAHLKASMMGFSETILIDEGQLVLGTWQSIYFCEFDGPRRRKVYVKIIEG